MATDIPYTTAENAPCAGCLQRPPVHGRTENFLFYASYHILENVGYITVDVPLCEDCYQGLAAAQKERTKADERFYPWCVPIGITAGALFSWYQGWPWWGTLILAPFIGSMVGIVVALAIASVLDRNNPNPYYLFRRNALRWLDRYTKRTDGRIWGVSLKPPE